MRCAKQVPTVPWNQLCRTQLWLSAVELCVPNSHVEVLTSRTPECNFGKRMVADVISEDELILEQGGPRVQRDWHPYNKRKLDISTHTESVPHKDQRDAAASQGTSRSWETGLEQILPQHLQRMCGRLTCAFWTSNLQNCEAISFCCSKPPSQWYFITAANKLGNQYSGPTSFSSASGFSSLCHWSPQLYVQPYAYRSRGMGEQRSLHFQKSTKCIKMKNESALPYILSNTGFQLHGNQLLKRIHERKQISQFSLSGLVLFSSSSEILRPH